MFRSPVHFPSQKPCGAIIDNTHPIFEHFPTEKYPDYQWKTLLDISKSVDISSFGDDFKPIIETVPNFVDNIALSPLFEAKIGNAYILFCGFDLDKGDSATKPLKACVFQYIVSDEFLPEKRS